jgi:hypothetical protein
MADYLTEHAAATYRLLSPESSGFLELNAFHPDYRPGRENTEWNRQRDTWPRLAYVSSEEEFLDFVGQYVGERMVCCGLNPRPTIRCNDSGYLRPSRESDIRAGRALLLDLDPMDSEAPDADNLERLLARADTYFQDSGLKRPSQAGSGRGYHLMAAYSPISTVETPDLKQRVRAFSDQFRDALGSEIGVAGLRLDGTYDLRRLVKVYGTAKPGGPVSRLLRAEYGADPALREKLLSYDVSCRSKKAESAAEAVDSVTVQRRLPDWFPALLDDQRVANLWNGEGKPESLDCSRSGYDFSLARTLIALGHNTDDIATILALRPKGAFKSRGRSPEYLETTISRARQSLARPKLSR